jgi:hypothetical protein
MDEGWLPVTLVGALVVLASAATTVRALRAPGGGGGGGAAAPRRKKEQKNLRTWAAEGVRFAEKNRGSTCAFADRVARLIIAAFRFIMNISLTFHPVPPPPPADPPHPTNVLTQFRPETNRGGKNLGRGAAEGVRFAEKNRGSTCAFADRVARLIIAAFRAQCPAALADSYRQTVLAGFVLENAATGALRVAAFGVGTKFLGRALVAADARGERVRDSHAEVLARRGLQRFLHAQARLALASDDNVSIFQRISRVGGAPLRLREGVHLHFYSSSVPCGNASIKRWAHPKRPRRRDLPASQYPTDPHPRFHVMQPEQGQVAPLVKLERPRAAVDVPSFLPIVVAPGTAPVGRGFGATLTCSDKLAVYNALGVQGCLLSCFFDPVYIRTFTVGRKFSEKTCQRGLCCRIAGFAFGEYSVNHPSMLQTSVKFDRGVVKATAKGDGACFREPRCVSWWRKACDIVHGCGDDGLDAHEAARVPGFISIVDGTTGLRPSSFGSGSSAICRASLLDDFRQTLRAWRPHVLSEFAQTLSAAEAKRRVGQLGFTRYTEAKRVLLWKWFPNWAEAKGVERLAADT